MIVLILNEIVLRLKLSLVETDLEFSTSGLYVQSTPRFMVFSLVQLVEFPKSRFVHKISTDILYGPNKDT